MVKLAVKDLEQFIANIPKNIRAILLYGPDAGLVKLRADLIVKSRSLADKFKYEQLKSDPIPLLDSLCSVKFFSPELNLEKIAIIECSSAALADPLLRIVKDGEYPGLLLFTASELGSDSSLRKAFESNSNCAAIPCYIDDQASIDRIIRQTLKTKEITIDASAMTHLVSSIPLGNRELIANELEKLLLFIGKKRHISIKDVDHLSPQGELSFNALCYHASLKQLKDIEPLLSKLQAQGHGLVAIIRMLINHFTRLYQVKCLNEQGKNSSEAMASLYPPVFFKQVADFNRSLKLWTQSELFAMLQSLSQLEVSAKQSAKPAALMLQRALTILSSN